MAMFGGKSASVSAARETPASWVRGKVAKGLGMFGLSEREAYRRAGQIVDPLVALTPLGVAEDAVVQSRQNARDMKAGKRPGMFGDAGVALAALGAVPGGRAVGGAAGRGAREIEAEVIRKFPGLKLDLSLGNGTLAVNRIVVPEGMRGRGIGTAAMRDILSEADALKVPVALTPDGAFGGSKSRLERFYRGLGFVKNSGRAKDYSISEAMYRPLPAAGEQAGGIIAYHGSPHKFDRFDMSKIGTGEGAQAYGHGLYFAEAEDVAKGYRDRIAGADWVDKRGITMQSNVIAQDVMEQARRDGLNVLDAQDAAGMWSLVARNGENASNFPGYESVKKVLDRHGIRLREKGHLYQVRINADPADFLDWDAPLPENARSAVEDALAPMDLGRDGMAAFWGKAGNAGNAINAAERSVPRGAITENLKARGYPGIKYLDAGSRGAGDGSRNYVVFDDKLIEILKRYAWVPGTAIPAAAMADYEKQTGRPVQTRQTA